MGMSGETSDGNGRICPDCNHPGAAHLVGIGCTVVIRWLREADVGSDPVQLNLLEESGIRDTAGGYRLHGEPIIPVLCPCMTGHDEGGR